MLVFLAVLWQRRKVETQTRNLTAGLWQSSKNGSQSSKIEQQRQSSLTKNFSKDMEKVLVIGRERFAPTNQNASNGITTKAGLG